jgi:hypothetical protein
MAYFSLSAGRLNKSCMKKLFTLLLAASFFGNSYAHGSLPVNPLPYSNEAVQVTIMDQIIDALRSGNASELAKYFDDNVEIALPSKSDSYSRSQAVMILQDFFANSGVKNFDVKFKGENGGSQYCVGTLQGRSGNHRTTFFLANRNGKQLVREIRFQTL